MYSTKKRRKKTDLSRTEPKKPEPDIKVTDTSDIYDFIINENIGGIISD